MDQNKIKQLAGYAISECTQHSEDGRWSISSDELSYHFGAEITDTNQNGKLLEEELRQREEINELIMTEDCIEMTCHLEYSANGVTKVLTAFFLLWAAISTMNTNMSLRSILPKKRRRLFFQNASLQC